MKKLLALVLAGAMALSMVACGGGEEAEGGAEGEDKLSVKLIVTNLGDKSFNDSANEGLSKLRDEGKIDYKVEEYGQDQSKVEITIQEAAEDYDVVAFNNLGFGKGGQWLKDNAANYPDTTFIIFDEPVEKFDAPNVQALCYRANESDFLAGALAAKLSETGVISFVGGMEAPVIHDFLVGYIEGAKYVNEDIKVVVSYTQNYQDSAKGKELGNAAIAAGADVVHAVAGGAGNGALEAAMEKGHLGIGVDSDQYAVFKENKPDLANSIVTSSIKNVGASLYSLISSMLDGTYEREEQKWYGMAENCSGLAENENYEKLVSEDIRAEINDIKAKISSGEIKVDTAYGMSPEDLNALVESVK